MTIETLIKAVPPPAVPFEAYSGLWESVEAELRTSLPQDYKDFARLYGSGYFLEFLGISIPRSQNPNVCLVRYVREVCATFSQDEELPYALWPEPGGIIPFGGTDNGDYLFWLPRDGPAEWGVVVWDRGMQGFEAFDCDLTDFLAGLATGEIVPKEFPEDLATADYPFVPSERIHASWRPTAVASLSEISSNGGSVASTHLTIHWRLGSYPGGLSGSSRCRVR